MDFLSSLDLTGSMIKEVFGLADSVASGKRLPALRGRPVVALFFEEASTRTRVSFEVAAAKLGGSAVYIDARTSQASRGEEIADTARVLSSYCDFIVARVNDHGQLLTMAKSSSAPVINALTHLEHPTQALADCYTIRSRKGALKGLRIAFVGDIAQNTANSLMVTAAKMGASVSLVGPRGCRPNPVYVREAKRHSSVEVYDSVKEGLRDADIVYTDTFVSMGDEREAALRRRRFAPYQLNSRALAFAKSDALVMHPLPAHRGMEIAANVIDGKRSVVWEQAHNKLVIEEALLLYLGKHR